MVTSHGAPPARRSGHVRHRLSSGMALMSVTLPARRPEGGFPLDLPVLAEGAALELAAGVTVLVGENGSGKSTLLEALALATEVATVGSNDDAQLDVTLGHLAPLADALGLAWTQRSRRGLFVRAEDYFGYVQRQRQLVRQLREEAARVAHESRHQHEGERRRRMGPFAGSAAAIESRYQGDLDARSHGESFLAFCKGRFTGTGLYLLDEPEAALSPVSQMAFLALVKEAVDRGGQFVIATHSPLLMAFPGALLYQLEGPTIARRNYDELQHVKLTREFLAAPGLFTRHL